MPISDLIPWKREKQETVRREEEHPLWSFRREMDRLFKDYLGEWGERSLAPFGEGWGAFSPQVDVTETDGEIKVSAELPGLGDEDIDVSLSNDVLTIRGEKKEEKEEKGRSYYRAERSYGSFVRSVPLPAEVDADKVDAVFQKGVLTVTLPKTGEARARKKIAIKTKVAAGS
jgi:HSP20 family protein